MKHAEVGERLASLGAEVFTSTTRQAADHIRAEVERWRKTIEPAGK